MWGDFHRRKADRKEHFFKWVYGWILVKCTACNGSGYYDHNGSPDCGACDGTGKDRVRGPKAIKPKDYHHDIDKELENK